MSTTTTNGIPSMTGPTRRQLSRLCGQAEAISIVAGELKRELLALPRSSLMYGRPGPPSTVLRGHLSHIDVLSDAIGLCQAANKLLRSLSYMPTVGDPEPTLE